VERGDLPLLKAIIDANALFPSEMLDDMTAAYLDGSSPDEIWTTFDDSGPIAVAYCVPERLTEGTWNLLLIAVHPDRHGQGVGSAVQAYVEQLLSERGARLLLVETSGLPAFQRTRNFYALLGYDEEARIREFYQAGEDKVIFRKALKPR
jgi:GNAT superfamily N-acetyltransferase